MASTYARTYLSLKDGKQACEGKVQYGYLFDAVFALSRTDSFKKTRSACANRCQWNCGVQEELRFVTSNRRWIDVDRLEAYEKLLSLPVDAPLQGKLTHHVTQRGKTDALLLVEQKNKFVRHLMYRQLELKGDL